MCKTLLEKFDALFTERKCQEDEYPMGYFVYRGLKNIPKTMEEDVELTDALRSFIEGIETK